MKTISQTLKDAAEHAERIERELEAAQVESDRQARANGDLCDDLATAGERIRALEAALLWFATNSLSPMGRIRARAVLLGIDAADGLVDEAWATSRFAGRDA